MNRSLRIANHELSTVNGLLLADGGFATFLDGDGYLLDNFEAEAFEGGDVHGGVGEQADALDSQVGQDLAAEADGAEDAAGAGLLAFAGAQFLMQ